MQIPLSVSPLKEIRDKQGGGGEGEGGRGGEDGHVYIFIQGVHFKEILRLRSWCLESVPYACIRLFQY